MRVMHIIRVVAREEGVKGGAEKPWKPRRRVYSQTGPALERRPIEDDPAFKTYIAKLNKPEKPLARANHLDCVGAAYVMLKSMGIPIIDHSLADLIRRKEENPRDMSIEKALTVLKSTPIVRTNTVHASRMVASSKPTSLPSASTSESSQDARRSLFRRASSELYAKTQNFSKYTVIF